MRVSKLIRDLTKVLAEDGDLEVTMVGTYGSPEAPDSDAFESTVEEVLVVVDDKEFGKHAKVIWQKG